MVDGSHRRPGDKELAPLRDFVEALDRTQSSDGTKPPPPKYTSAFSFHLQSPQVPLWGTRSHQINEGKHAKKCAGFRPIRTKSSPTLDFKVFYHQSGDGVPYFKLLDTGKDDLGKNELLFTSVGVGVDPLMALPKGIPLSGQFLYPFSPYG
ncbi:hypothetical protein PIB30_060556 [Stylosanthes scabra]|uniref:FAD-binding FR-type domain-containing protein n=1 Tax=Stylosanthes scabra TaxID=79078 RepID=A0ABU6TL90_9FABA|nr:hypothetical protein [Stylosanthes scabra]